MTLRWPGEFMVRNCDPALGVEELLGEVVNKLAGAVPVAFIWGGGALEALAADADAAIVGPFHSSRP